MTEDTLSMQALVPLSAGNQSHISVLYEEIQTTIRNKNAVVIGDFNCSNINWNLMHGDQEGNRLVDMVEDSFLSQLVTQPTS